MDYSLSRPTMASPGSSAKLEIMTLRAANSQELFHPHDSRECTRLQSQRTPKHSAEGNTIAAAQQARQTSLKKILQA